MPAIVRQPVFLVWLLGIGLVGCSNPHEYPTTPVSGVVTCNGKPVANATVNFTPHPEEGRAEGQRGRPALGITDKDGKFSLTTYTNYDGAIVGKHTVTVGLNADEVTGRAAPFPCRDSSMEVTVERGTKEYNIDFSNGR